MKKIQRFIIKSSNILTKQYYYFYNPFYYNYAKENIKCDCSLCGCPGINNYEYSFVYICEKRKFIYYDIPKCASTTLRYLLFQNNNSYSMRDPRMDLDSYFKFAFVRNPWDRMVSNWKMFTSKKFPLKQLHTMTNRDLSRFEDFVNFSVNNHNHHWQPQVLFLPDNLDYIGRVETFEADYKYICNNIGIRAESIEQMNKTDRKSYWNYYNKSTLDLVSKFYSKDIERFGYNFEELGP